MPIYEYKCSACQHEMESLQKFSDAPLVACPACGKDALTKLVSAAGFQLKGSGWYQTDFKGSGSKPAAKVDAAKSEGGKDVAPSDSAKSADTKSTESKSSDTKTAAPVASAPAATSSTSTPGA
ncbi:MAG: zinc ribbon domain-containing protein [Betaproteobacteria bacterium]